VKKYQARDTVQLEQLQQAAIVAIIHQHHHHHQHLICIAHKVSNYNVEEIAGTTRRKTALTVALEQ